MVDAVNRYSKMDLEVAPTLFLEFHGTSGAAVEEAATAAGALVDDCGGGGFRWASAPEERTRLWAARHSAYYAGGCGWSSGAEGDGMGCGKGCGVRWSGPP